MKLILDGGAEVDIGETEAAPTISLIDYSRRDTDDFGVTTVVKRAFARQMSVRVKVQTADVDAVQRQLAAVRATPAHWQADDRFGSLSFVGFYKDFSLDIAMPPVSYSTLTIEGLAEESVYADDGSEPAPVGPPSTLRMLQPDLVTDAVLTASNLVENDYPEWAADISYPLGAHVILAATHRIYESAAADNEGHDPSGTAGMWIDVGPTNRWAMFDQALGTTSEATGNIVMTVDPADAIDAIALLDVSAALVRVQAAGYDRAKAPPAAPGMVTFLDMPATTGPVTVTIAGTTTAVGSLLMGRLRGLGRTEAGPTAGITDYSRKETDDFGEVTLVERAWAKRMSAKALIDTAAIDLVVGRLANARGMPCLWMANEALESLSIYGFFKDASIEVGQHVSTLSLSIEGLSAAAKLAPLTNVEVSWPDIKDDDPDHPKPADGATVGAPAGTNVGGRPAEQVIADMDAAVAGIAAETMRAALWRGESDQIIHFEDGTDVRQVVEAIGSTTAEHSSYVAFLKEVGTDGRAKFMLTANSDGDIVGIQGTTGFGDEIPQLSFVASRFLFVDNSGANPVNAFVYEGGEWRLKVLRAERILAGAGNSAQFASAAASGVVAGTGIGNVITVLTKTVTLLAPGSIQAIAALALSYSGAVSNFNLWLYIGGVEVFSVGGGTTEVSAVLAGSNMLAAGTYTVEVKFAGPTNMSVAGRNVSTTIVYA